MRHAWKLSLLQFFNLPLEGRSKREAFRAFARRSDLWAGSNAISFGPRRRVGVADSRISAPLPSPPPQGGRGKYVLSIIAVLLLAAAPTYAEEAGAPGTRVPAWPARTPLARQPPRVAAANAARADTALPGV